jgi:hypothetical protein
MDFGLIEVLCNKFNSISIKCKCDFIVILEKFGFIMLKIFKETTSQEFRIRFRLNFIGSSVIALNINGLERMRVKKIGKREKARCVGESLSKCFSVNRLQRFIVINAISFGFVILAYKRCCSINGSCKLKIGFFFNSETPEKFLFTIFNLVFFVFLQLHALICKNT